MKILSVHAHCDDFEFYLSGTFELWRQKLGRDLQSRVLVCTDGAAGHQFRTRAETARMRFAEQTASADVGAYEFEMLRLPNGQHPREGFQVTSDLLAGLWKSIRNFAPDYLFCPPPVMDPLAGMHNDHQTVADAIRRVAYFINVPHAFTPEYPADETQSQPCKVPVILTIYDTYMAGSNAFDLAVNIEPAFDRLAEMSWCHQSQITEWLPWVGRHRMEPAKSLTEFKAMLRTRFQRRNRELGIQLTDPVEVFSVTAWGETPEYATLLKDFPGLIPEYSNLERLKKRLDRWREGI
jgi:LmbE family N-acetylglucosaminyl deacetylase